LRGWRRQKRASSSLVLGTRNYVLVHILHGIRPKNNRYQKKHPVIPEKRIVHN